MECIASNSVAGHVMAAKSKLSIFYALCLLAHTCRAAYKSAGCSDEGCGIPCYMRPAADNCHYKPQSPCSNEGYDLDLENFILDLNSSLHRLENKLVQKSISESNHVNVATYLHMLVTKLYYSYTVVYL